MRIAGNPSEAAMLRFVERLASVEQLRAEYEIVFEIPFNSVRKWHLVIARKNGAKEESYVLMMKGAPEVLINRCGFYAGEQGQNVINEEFNMDFQDAYLHFGNEGRFSKIR